MYSRPFLGPIPCHLTWLYSSSFCWWLWDFLWDRVKNGFLPPREVPVDWTKDRKDMPWRMNAFLFPIRKSPVNLTWPLYDTTSPESPSLRPCAISAGLWLRTNSWRDSWDPRWASKTLPHPLFFPRSPASLHWRSDDVTMMALCRGRCSFYSSFGPPSGFQTLWAKALSPPAFATSQGGSLQR